MELGEQDYSSHMNKENLTLQQTEVVEKILKFAKLDINDLKPDVQQVYFDNNLQTDGLKLLELNPSTLHHLENGGKLILKGLNSENCVLCTDEATFDVKDAEISNALLLVSGANFDLPAQSQSKADKNFLSDIELNARRNHNDNHNGTDNSKDSDYRGHDKDNDGVAGNVQAECGSNTLAVTPSKSHIRLSKIRVSSTCHCYLELRAIKPRINAIMKLLGPTSYDGPEHEADVFGKLTMNDLVSLLPASNTELVCALSSLNIVELNGYVRMVDFDYLARVISSISALIEENSWHFGSFSRLETLATLEELYPVEIIDHALQSYGYSLGPANPHSDIWQLDEEKVCKFFAEMLLRPTTKFNLEEFLTAWKDSVPEGMMTQLTQLRGIAFLESETQPAVIRYFPVQNLSEDIKVRFEELFEAKDRWSLEEITPYIEPLTVGKLTVSVLVMKHARSFSSSGVKYFTRKYMKQ